MRVLTVVMVGVVGLVLAASARAQGSCTFTDDATGKVVTWPDCKPPADEKSGSAPPTATKAAPGTPTAAPTSAPTGGKSFPYPGEEPTSAAKQAPAAQTPAAQTPAAGNRFPYPGEEPATSGGGLKDAGSSGESSSSASGVSGSSSQDSQDSSSSSSSSSGSGSGTGPLAEDDDDAAAKAAAKRRKKMPKVERQSPTEREEEDLKVAEFYMNDKNWKAAYMRATDAVSIADDDADAHFALAEAARRLGKLDEAQKQYKRCLELDPVEKEKKTAEKALKEMSGEV